jgi:hypothetical protein
MAAPLREPGRRCPTPEIEAVSSNIAKAQRRAWAETVPRTEVPDRPLLSCIAEECHTWAIDRATGPVRPLLTKPPLGLRLFPRVEPQERPRQDRPVLHAGTSRRRAKK